MPSTPSLEPDPGKDSRSPPVDLEPSKSGPGQPESGSPGPDKPLIFVGVSTRWSPDSGGEVGDHFGRTQGVQVGGGPTIVDGRL